MNTKQDWFDRWPEPGGSADCPPESKLVEWASRPESSEAKSHLAQCSKCVEVVNIVRESADGSSDNLHDFMSEVRKRAQKEEEEHISLWRTSFNYVLASRARAVGAIAGLAALFLIASSGLWRQLGILQPQSQIETIRMDPDTNGQFYASAIDKLRQSYANMSSEKLSRDQATKEIDELNSALSKVDRSRLRPEQVSQLEALQAKYQTLVFQNLQPSSNSSSDSSYARSLANAGQPLVISPIVQSNRIDFASAHGISANQQNIGSNGKNAQLSAQSIQETERRFSELTEYDVKSETSLNFGFGSAKLSAPNKEALQVLVRNAIYLPNYMIEVKSYVRGDDGLNDDRTQAVIAYLVQDLNVPAQRVVPPETTGGTQETLENRAGLAGASKSASMSAQEVSANQNPAGRATNRGIEVKVLVGKGTVGK